MPVTIASCCSEPSRPRIRGGDLGDVGGRDDRRHADAETADDPEHEHPELIARPAPIALIRNSTAAILITDSRPMWSAIRPATNAPAAAPSSADATAKPSELPIWNCSSNGRHSAVDDRAVVPEQEPAEGCYRGDADDAAAVFGLP